MKTAVLQMTQKSLFLTHIMGLSQFVGLKSIFGHCKIHHVRHKSSIELLAFRYVHFSTVSWREECPDKSWTAIVRLSI